MPQDGYRLASFELIPSPSKVGFSAAKKLEIPHAKLLFLFLLFQTKMTGGGSAKILSRRSRL